MSKFDGPISEWVYGEGEFDEEVGDSSSGVGWAGLWRIREDIEGGLILFEKTSGEVTHAEYRTDAELFTAWAEVDEALSMDGPEPSEGDWVVQDVKGGYAATQNGRTDLFTGVAGIDPVLRRIKLQMDHDQFWTNVWHVSDHGNYTLLDLDEMGIK